MGAIYSKRIHFVDGKQGIFDNIKILDVDCRDVFTSNKLFETFARCLEFPKYFGWNWDAFDECFWDMEWIKDKYRISDVGIYVFNIDNLLSEEEGKRELFWRIMNSDYSVSLADEQGKLNFPMNIQLFFNENEKQYVLQTPVTILWNSQCWK